jgi:hypothetical protein
MMNKQNIQIPLSSLGQVELRHISLNDLRFTDILLEQEGSERDFATNVLYHQLVAPELNLSKFRELSDDDIEFLARSFIRNEVFISRFFQDSGEFYNDFKISFVVARKKLTELITENLKPLFNVLNESCQSISKTISEWAGQYKDILDNVSKELQKFQQVYSIAVPRAEEIFKKYKWFPSPDFHISFILRVVEIEDKPGRHDKVINDLL